jgi:hypothetical protein
MSRIDISILVTAAIFKGWQTFWLYLAHSVQGDVSLMILFQNCVRQCCLPSKMATITRNRYSGDMSKKFYITCRIEKM